MHLNAKVAFLKYILLATGSHFSYFSAGVTCSNFLIPQTTQQARLDKSAILFMMVIRVGLSKACLTRLI